MKTKTLPQNQTLTKTPMIKYSFLLQVPVNQILVLLKGITAALVIIFLPKITSVSVKGAVWFSLIFAVLLVKKLTNFKSKGRSSC